MQIAWFRRIHMVIIYLVGILILSSIFCYCSKDTSPLENVDSDGSSCQITYELTLPTAEQLQFWSDNNEWKVYRIDKINPNLFQVYWWKPTNITEYKFREIVLTESEFVQARERSLLVNYFTVNGNYYSIFIDYEYEKRGN